MGAKAVLGMERIGPKNAFLYQSRVKSKTKDQKARNGTEAAEPMTNPLWGNGQLRE